MAAKKKKPVPPVIVAALKQIVAHAEHSKFRHLQYTVLDLVASGSLSQVGLRTELARVGYPISISRVSRVVSDLEKRGLLARNAGANARTKRIALTTKGRHEAKSYEEQLATFAVQFLKRAAHPVVELHLDCPSCGRKLRISKHGPGVKNRCRTCSHQFFVRFEGDVCVVEPCEVARREHEPPVNPYEELQVPRGATREQLSAAKRTFLKRYHPDLFHSLGPEFVALATRRSQRINRAFDQLVR